MFRHSLALLLSTAIGVTAAVDSKVIAQDEDAFTTQSITDAIHVLLGSGGNVGVFVGEDGVFLIDDSLAPMTEKLQAAVEELSDRPIEFVINTHWHFDHTGGNEVLGKSGTLIVAHDNVRERMSVENVLEAIGMEFPASPEGALPVITFSEAVTFHLNGEAVEVFHVAAAHTDGDAVVYFPEANVIHAGDTYFNGSYPFVDAESGGSIEGLIAAADQLLALADDDTTIIPGHGELSTMDELEVYRDMLVDVRERTLEAIADGQTLDEFITSDPTADLDDEWGGGIHGTGGLSDHLV